MTAHLVDISESSVSPLTQTLIKKRQTQSGFSFRRYNMATLNVSELSSTHHRVRFNCSNRVLMSWKREKEWMKSMCEKGNVITLTPAGTSETVQVLGPCDNLEISFEPDFINRLIEKENVQLQSQYNLHDFVLSDLAKKYSESKIDSSLAHLYTQSLAVTCAVHLVTNYSTNQKKIFAPKGKLSSHQLKKLIDFVEANIHKVITLDEMASLVYLSAFHFSRLFKNTLGVSPYQFVLNMKVDYAKKLIKNKHPVSDVAYALAFTDSAHFCNAFKKLTGCSPLQYSVT